jgi:hypothetical protein
MNVPAIYEDQAKGARKVKQYRFFPGTPDPAAVRAALLADMDTIATDVTARYKALSDSMNLLLAGQSVVPKLTNFAPGGDTIIKDGPTAMLAGVLIKDIQAKLEQTQAQIIAWVAGRKAKAQKLTTNDALRAYYVKTLERANECSPQTSSIFIQKGKQEPYLSSKVVVANVPSGAVLGEEHPLADSLDIALRNAFVKLKGATPATYAERIKGTDIDNRFLSKVPAAPAPVAVGAPPAQRQPNEWEGRLRQKGGDIGSDLDMSSLSETVNEVIGAELPDDVIGSQQADGVQKGGAKFLFVRFQNMGPDISTELVNVLKLFPTIADFVQYMYSKGVSDPQHWILAIYDVIRRRNTDRVVDLVLANELMLEFLELIGAYPNTTSYVNIPGASTAIFQPDYVYSDRKYPSSTATILFNAYTYNVNARNATLVDSAKNEVETQSTKDFTTIEGLYLSKVPFIDLRGRKVLAFAVLENPIATVVKGGLRDRRPLYAKNVGSSGTMGIDDGGDNQGLRKRSRARTTPRVRKHSGSPKTRRQRKYVDRV